MRTIAATAASALLLLTGCSAPATSAGTQAAAPATASAEAPASSEAAAPTETADSDFAVTIDGSHQTKTYNGKPALVVDFTFTNKSDKPATFLTSISAKAFQNGVEDETAIIMNDKKYDSAAGMKEIKPGAKIKVQEAYALADKSEVTIEVTEVFNFADTMLATKKIAIK